MAKGSDPQRYHDAYRTSSTEGHERSEQAIFGQINQTHAN